MEAAMSEATKIPYKIYLEESEIPGRLQFFLQAISPHQGRGTVHFIKVLYLLRNRNICRGII